MAPDCDRLLAALLKELQLALSGLGRRHVARDPDVLAVALEAVRSVQWIDRRLQADQFVAAFAGLAKVGKSTLLNAMLGEEVTPRKSTPMTRIPIEFRHGEALQGTAEYRQSYRRVTEAASDAQQLRTFIERYATEGGEHATADVRRVRVTLPAAILSDGLTLSDTPGFGSVQLGNEAGGHAAALKEYLPNVHQLFWVVLFEQGVTRSEVEFFNACLRGICEDVVVTGCDAADTPADLLRFKKCFQESLGLNFLRFHFVSGKQALQATRCSDVAGLKASGLPGLTHRLNRIASRDSRRDILLMDLDALCADLGEWLRGKGLGPRAWPPTDWARLQHVARKMSVADDVGTECMGTRLARYLCPMEDNS